MTDEFDYRLIAAVQAGLPITSRPYAAIAERLGVAEQEVIDRLAHLKSQGLIKRWGVVVKHRQLGYQANAMIVMDIPDARVAEIGVLVSRQACVNLCYRRPRQGDVWPYNLYCMIHGKSRETVLQQWAELLKACGLSAYAHEVLFSRRCFKQRGALYARHLGSRNGALEYPANENRAEANLYAGENLMPERRVAPGFSASGISANAEQHKFTAVCPLPAV